MLIISNHFCMTKYCFGNICFNGAPAAHNKAIFSGNMVRKQQEETRNMGFIWIVSAAITALYRDRLYGWASDEVFQSNMLSGISFVPSATNHPSSDRCTVVKR